MTDKAKHITKITGAQLIQQEIQAQIRECMSGAISSATLAALAALDPPLTNRGGTSLVPPISCYKQTIYTPFMGVSCHSDTETVTRSANQKTHLDFLTFSFPVPSPTIASDEPNTSGLEAFLYGFQALEPDALLVKSQVGMRGYPHAKAIVRNEEQLGLIGYGAQHGIDHVSLPGAFCSSLTHEKISLLAELLKILNARLTRVDLALDFYRGEVTYDDALFAYDYCQFQTAKSPANPTKQIIESVCAGKNQGRTLYVGARAGHVMARIYEKGLEVFSRLPEEYREASTEREVTYYAETGQEQPSGTVADTWVRVEVEYKRKDGKELDLSMLYDRDAYFAGAYPFTADCLKIDGGKRPKTMKAEKQMELDKLISELRRSYGNTIYSLTELGFTPDEIIEFTSTGRHNQKLVKSGLMEMIKADEKYQAAVAANAKSKA